MPPIKQLVRSRRSWAALALAAAVVALAVAVRPSEPAPHFRPTTVADVSSNRPIKEAGDTMALDFAKCTPDLFRTYLPMGSFTFEMAGTDGRNCLLNFGGEVEDPTWNGDLLTTCKVPASAGTVTLRRGETKVDTSPLDAYCHAR